MCEVLYLALMFRHVLNIVIILMQWIPVNWDNRDYIIFPPNIRNYT
jgi:hypothetical protein